MRSSARSRIRKRAGSTVAIMMVTSFVIGGFLLVITKQLSSMQSFASSRWEQEQVDWLFEGAYERAVCVYDQNEESSLIEWDWEIPNMINGYSTISVAAKFETIDDSKLRLKLVLSDRENNATVVGQRDYVLNTSIKEQP